MENSNISGSSLPYPLRTPMSQIRHSNIVQSRLRQPRFQSRLQRLQRITNPFEISNNHSDNDNIQIIIESRELEPVYISATLQNLREKTEIEVFKLNSGEEFTCSICRSIIENEQITRKINYCQHIFHQECIDQWFENHIDCPNCRHDIRTQTSDVQGESEEVDESEEDEERRGQLDQIRQRLSNNELNRELLSSIQDFLNIIRDFRPRTDTNPYLEPHPITPQPVQNVHSNELEPIYQTIQEHSRTELPEENSHPNEIESIDITDLQLDEVNLDRPRKISNKRSRYLKRRRSPKIICKKKNIFQRLFRK